MNSKDVAFIIVLFLLIFLFQGDPDLWDLLHAKAMTWASAK